MVRSSEIGDCIMLFMFTSARKRNNLWHKKYHYFFLGGVEIYLYSSFGFNLNGLNPKIENVLFCFFLFY